MKKTLAIFLSTLLFIPSCNPKEKIVERQKAIKNEFTILDARSFELSEQDKILEDDEHQAMSNMFKNNTDTSAVMNIRRKILYVARSIDKNKDLKEKLVNEYDSLEMELKKY